MQAANPEFRGSRDLIYALKELAKANVRFVICGGVACVLQGVERATYDIDMNVKLEKENLEKLIQVIRELKLKPRIPQPVEDIIDERKRKEWVEKMGALVYTFVSEIGPLQIDIFLSYPKTFDELMLNSDEIEIDGIKLKVSSIEDLLFVKKLVDPVRDKDLMDIKELERIYAEKNKSGNG